MSSWLARISWALPVQCTKSYHNYCYYSFNITYSDQLVKSISNQSIKAYGGLHKAYQKMFS